MSSRESGVQTKSRRMAQLHSALQDRAEHGHRETIWRTADLSSEMREYGGESVSPHMVRPLLRELESRGTISVIPHGRHVRVFFFGQLC